MSIHEKWFKEAAKTALQATCRRALCGAVIVKDDEVIGYGFNAPPLNDEGNRTCDAVWNRNKKPKYDLTCCVHAEWNAILDACKRAGSRIEGSTLYFMRTNENGEFTDAGKPFCTVCSRLALQSGVKLFGLWNGGPEMIDTVEYNRSSYEFHSGSPSAQGSICPRIIPGQMS